MKQKINPVINDDTVKLLLSCMVCSKKITDHFYGRWGLTTGTCSRKCEQVQEDKPKYEGVYHGTTSITRKESDNAIL